jgi:hypothetical protein
MRISEAFRASKIGHLLFLPPMVQNAFDNTQIPAARIGAKYKPRSFRAARLAPSMTKLAAT